MLLLIVHRKVAKDFFENCNTVNFAPFMAFTTMQGFSCWRGTLTWLLRNVCYNGLVDPPKWFPLVIWWINNHYLGVLISCDLSCLENETSKNENIASMGLANHTLAKNEGSGLMPIWQRCRRNAINRSHRNEGGTIKKKTFFWVNIIM